MKTIKKLLKNKYILLALLLIVLIIVIRYFTKDYEVIYNIKDYKITEKTDKKTISLSIEKDKIVYKYLLLSKRKLKRKIVKEIKEETINDSMCLKPIIKGIDTYTVCYKDNEFTTKEIAYNKELDNYYSSDLDFNKLNDKEYMLLWKYDGFYTFNNDVQDELNIFETNRYSNDLMIQIGKYLVFPKYEDNYTFTDFYVIDMTSFKTKIIKGKNMINYDSYYAGNYKNNLYLFDNKNENLYKINYKKRKIELVGSKIIGYEKIENKRVKSASLKEYTQNKITYFNNKKSKITINNNYISYDNFNLKYAPDNINVIYNKDYSIYYIYNDNIYKYQNEITTKILHYFELNFNSDNKVFIYQK